MKHLYPSGKGLFQNERFPYMNDHQGDNDANYVAQPLQSPDLNLVKHL